MGLFQPMSCKMLLPFPGDFTSPGEPPYYCIYLQVPKPNVPEHLWSMEPEQDKYVFFLPHRPPIFMEKHFKNFILAIYYITICVSSEYIAFTTRLGV
ncbi:hypothetical protein GDO81_015544 [Engystomops pustulosus]|uniref:Uncharacterized protein n=1 Tax=Engystomops pustulosus TaxID=76066 RepID=A0AAV7AV23_ENGPU|nr:hypothetical protein GDO81_015544 [Engystomops pustulosus]